VALRTIVGDPEGTDHCGSNPEVGVEKHWELASDG